MVYSGLLDISLHTFEYIQQGFKMAKQRIVEKKNYKVLLIFK